MPGMRECEEKCPQGMPIREYLKKVAATSESDYFARFRFGCSVLLKVHASIQEGWSVSSCALSGDGAAQSPRRLLLLWSNKGDADGMGFFLAG